MARKVGLQQADVVDAAVHVAGRDGLDAVTLAAVASELGVRSPSLYSHVDGLAGLRRAMALHAVARFTAGLDDAITGRHGADALRALAHAYRRFALDTPALYAAMLPAPTADDAELYAAFAAPVALMADVLGDVGVDAADGVHVIRGFRSALHGFVSLEAGGGFAMPEDVDTSFATLVDLLITSVGETRRSPSPRSRRPAGNR